MKNKCENRGVFPNTKSYEYYIWEGMRILSHLEKQERKEHFVFCTLKGKGASALGSGNTAADVMAVFQLLTKADE